jgi:uncharacterized protein YdhG (YjbR/CyaY superfamily)
LIRSVRRDIGARPTHAGTLPVMPDRQSPTAQVDAILASIPSDQRELLERVRRTIAAAAPEAEESITYGMPAFRYHDRSLMSYSPFKQHCSLFPMSGAVIGRHRDQLASFETGKGTLRFTPSHPIPADVIVALVHDRMAEIDERDAST